MLVSIVAAAVLGIPAKRPPNIVFILIDDMGWKDIGANGSKFYRTPNIDALAKESARFTNGYASCAVCSPTRAAIMTGKNPQRLHITDWIEGEGAPKDAVHQIPKWQMSLPMSETTLPQVLREKGYVTAAIGKWHLGGDDADKMGPKAHGFDINIAGGHMGHPASYFWPYGKEGNDHRVPGLAESGGAEGEYLTDRLTDEAIKFIDAEKAKPFFLYLAHYAVHAPIMGKQVDIDAFQDAMPDGGQKSPIYAAMVKSVDDGVGRINTEIKRLGLENDTIVIFTSDNGGATHFANSTSNAPLRAQKGFPYEGGIRVPLIVKIPGITKPGSVSDQPIVSTDFFPTLAHLAGARVPQDLDGIDVKSAFANRKIQRAPMVWHYPHYWAGGTISPYSVYREGKWKLVRWWDYNSQELYNLEKDPYERTDLAVQEPNRVRDLAKRLDQDLQKEGAQLPIAFSPPRPFKDPATNPAHAARFR